jgi:prepilin-type processing-associated H-X9-DG protein
LSELGDVLYAAKELRDAVDAYKKALVIDSRLISAWTGLAHTRIALGDRPKAADAYKGLGMARRDQARLATGAASQNPLNVTNVPFGTWDASAANDLNYFATCNTPTAGDYDYTGLEYYRGAVPWTGFYTHTVTPNYVNRDCVRGTGLNKGHQASRSYHTRGVNLLLCDGSVRFVSDDVSLNTWRAVGTRAGSDTVGADFD